MFMTFQGVALEARIKEPSKYPSHLIEINPRFVRANPRRPLYAAPIRVHPPFEPAPATVVLGCLNPYVVRL